MKGGVAMKKNPSYITRLLEASSKVEAYRIRQELEQKLQTGFKPDELRDFINELLEFVHRYRELEKDAEILSMFAKLIADYIPARYFERDL
jgi:uncharacterized protein (UPF0305 family)